MLQSVQSIGFKSKVSMSPNVRNGPFQRIYNLRISHAFISHFHKSRNNILADFLKKNKAEILRMNIFEYDQEKHMRQTYEETRGCV